ncbi:helix-turn-helix transcriptional regulator [Lentzea tibetensis]|nr:helix-turn-helix transcriptional regulator [Lentzea tibetensis]
MSMKLQAFGRLLAEEHARTVREHEALLAAFADLDLLCRRPSGACSPDVTVLDDVVGTARELHESASSELLDVLPPWFPPGEPVGHRVLRDQLPVLLRVADREVVLVGESAGSGLLVRSGLARGMGQLFDLLWDRVTASVRDQVLRLMAAGMDDTEVAAATGRSVRTVRTHVAAIMTELGAGTRLAAGVAAVRRGWL